MDQLIFRPVPSLNPYSTPLRGLFIGSASTFPGGAVHGVNAAAAAARRAWRSPPVYLARMSGTLDQRARRGRLGDRLPQRRLLRAPARAARRRGPADRLRDPHDALASARPPPPARARRARLSSRVLSRADPRQRPHAARDAGPRAALRRRRAPDRPLVSGGLPRRRAARARDRLRDAGRARRLQARVPPAPRQARRADAARARRATSRSGTPTTRSRSTSAPRTLAALARPETWPDYASDLGRFTAVRSGGLAGQTFEIEVISALTPRTPAILRGYVSVDALLHARRPRGRARALRRAPQRAHGPLRPRPAARLPARLHAAGRDLPRHARGPLHGPRAQPAARLRARRPGLPARGRHLGRHAGHARAGLPLRGPQGAAGVLGRRAAGVEHAAPDRAADGGA